MTAKTTSSASGKFTWKRALHALMSFIAVLLAATLLTSCGRKTALKEYQKGIAAYEKQDYEAAVNHFSKAAKKGDSDAMLMKGLCLIAGKGCEENEREGLLCLRAAADAGNTDALAWIGSVLCHTTHTSKDEKKQGVEYLKNAIDHGCIFAMHTLGSFYSFGYEYTGDADWKGKCVKYYKMAAEQPLSQSKEKTFWDYYDTAWEGSTWDAPSRDGKKFSGVNNYIVTAQHDLGVFYERREDYEEAKKWFKMAGDNGYPGMKEELEYLDEMK